MNPSTTSEGAGETAAEAALRQEVLETARRAATDRIQAAERQAADLVAAARAEAEREVEGLLADAAREADRRGASIRASIPMEIRRGEAARREAELEAIRDEALRRLGERDTERRGADVSAVVPPAIAAMEGTSFVLSLSPADREFADRDFLDRLERSLAPRSVRLSAEFDDTVPPGGVVIESEGGAQRWDNTPVARCARLWPELRLHVAIAAGRVAEGGSA